MLHASLRLQWFFLVWTPFSKTITNTTRQDLLPSAASWCIVASCSWFCFFSCFCLLYYYRDWRSLSIMVVLGGLWVLVLLLLLATLAPPLATATGRGGETSAAFQFSAARGPLDFVRCRSRQTGNRSVRPRNPSSRAVGFLVLLRAVQQDDVENGGGGASSVDLSVLRTELSQYLKKRSEVDADTLAKQYVVVVFSELPVEPCSHPSPLTHLDSFQTETLDDKSVGRVGMLGWIM